MSSQNSLLFNFNSLIFYKTEAHGMKVRVEPRTCQLIDYSQGLCADLKNSIKLNNSVNNV